MSGAGWGIPEQTNPNSIIEPDLSHLLDVDDRAGAEPFTIFADVHSCLMCGAALSDVSVRVPVALRLLGRALIAGVAAVLQAQAPAYCPTCSVEWLVSDAARAAHRAAYLPGSPVARCTLDRCPVGGPHHHTSELATVRLGPLEARLRA